MQDIFHQQYLGESYLEAQSDCQVQSQGRQVHIQETNQAATTHHIRLHSCLQTTRNLEIIQQFYRLLQNLGTNLEIPSPTLEQFNYLSTFSEKKAACTMNDSCLWKACSKTTMDNKNKKVKQKSARSQSPALKINQWSQLGRIWFIPKLISKPNFAGFIQYESGFTSSWGLTLVPDSWSSEPVPSAPTMHQLLPLLPLCQHVRMHLTFHPRCGTKEGYIPELTTGWRAPKWWALEKVDSRKKYGRCWYLC